MASQAYVGQWEGLPVGTLRGAQISMRLKVGIGITTRLASSRGPIERTRTRTLRDKVFLEKRVSGSRQRYLMSKPDH